jgi:hypothetical protein
VANELVKVEDVQGRFKRLYESLDVLGQRELRNELRRSLAEATKASRTRIRDGERAYLPQRGGARRRFARIPTMTMGTAGHEVSVKLVQQRRKSDMQALNRGILRHPVFGNRKVWKVTTIRRGMWDDQIGLVAPAITLKVIANLNRVVESKTKGTP